jgi:hypothetical protein
VVALLGLRQLLRITRLCIVRTRFLNRRFALFVILVLFLKKSSSFWFLVCSSHSSDLFLKVSRSGSLSRRPSCLHPRSPASIRSASRAASLGPRMPPRPLFVPAPGATAVARRPASATVATTVMGCRARTRAGSTRS